MAKLTLTQKIKKDIGGYKNIAGRNFFLILCFGILFNIFTSFLISTVKLPGGAVEKYGKSVGSVLNGELAITIIFILMSPFAEEILFRGIIFNVCSKFGDVFAIIFSSLAFALAHGQILWSIYTFFLGVLLCIIYRKYATIWAPILMHFSFNLASVAMILLSGNSIYLKFTSSEIFRIFVIFISAIFLAILTKKIFQRKTQKNDN